MTLLKMAYECAKMLRDIVFRTQLSRIPLGVVGRPTLARGTYGRAAAARWKDRAGEAACFCYRALLRRGQLLWRPAVALDDVAGGYGLRARERQLHVRAFRWER